MKPNRETELKIVPVNRPLEKTMVVHHRLSPNKAGEFVMDLCRVGMIAAPNTRWLEPFEVVARAFAITEKLVDGLEERGWLMDVPSYSELENEERTKTGF